MPPSVVLSGLVLNEKGLERGLTCGVPMFCMGVSASETHSKKNTGMSVSEATNRILAMGKLALQENRSVQVSVQSAFGCGYEGHVTPERVVSIVSRYLGGGSRAYQSGRHRRSRVTRYGGDICLHPSANSTAAAESGVPFPQYIRHGLAELLRRHAGGGTSIESSVAGLGGCPFTKSPVEMCAPKISCTRRTGMGMRTDVRLERIDCGRTRGGIVLHPGDARERVQDGTIA